MGFSVRGVVGELGGLAIRDSSSLKTNLSLRVASDLSNSKLGPELRLEMRTESVEAEPTICLSCCSFFTSVSRAWKSMLSKATMLLTNSILLRTCSTLVLPCKQAVDWSRGAMRDILTKQARMGLRDSSLHARIVCTSTQEMALKTTGDTPTSIL